MLPPSSLTARLAAIATAALMFGFTSASPLEPRQSPASMLFPATFRSGWTTSQTSIPNVINVLLTDLSLGVNRVSSGTTHNVVTMNGKQAWEAFYPKNSRNPSSDIRGGFGFYLSGPQSWNLSGAREVIFSYSVFFQPGFQWKRGGKLPGLFGGIGELAYGCSGGRDTDRDKCFDLRYMWRTNGAGELYAYLPPNHPNTDAALLAVGPYSTQNTDYGFSVGRGSFVFKAGSWNTIAERVRLNTPGREDGEVEVYFNGRSAFRASGLAIREAATSKFTGVHFQTFFGGSTEAWNSPQDQRAYFADISGAFVQ